VHARAKTLVDAGHGQTLIAYWPADIPGFKTDHQHTAAELDQIVAAIRNAEDEHHMPWHPDDKPSLPRELGESPLIRIAAPAIDEGPLVDDATYNALKERHQALPKEQRAILERITDEALQAHASISLRQLRSVRRWEIARALIMWCEAGWDDDVIRDLLLAITADSTRHHNNHFILGSPLGSIIGTLRIDQARTLADMAQQVLDGTHIPWYDDITDRRWQLIAS
jgi:hypothetical protein